MILPTLFVRLRPLWLLLALSGLLVACSGGDGPSEPSDDPPDNGDPPDVQLATLEVTTRLGSDFQQIGEDLGWEGRTVPGALVSVRRRGSQSVDSLRADETGTAVFEELLEGNYTISAVRRLGPAEQERLSGDFEGVAVLGAATSTQLQPTAEQRTLEIRAGRRGSIVISELYNRAISGAGGTYHFGHYLELYNNADSTVYLDGLLVGNGFDRSVDGGEWPCSDFEYLQRDPEGLWVDYVFQVPGGGRSYPLGPGESTLLATDAIDHSEFVQAGPDLSGADFEFIGRNDVDNPAVPNLTSIGPHIDNVQHGIVFHSIQALPYVARFVDLDGLPRETVVIGSQERELVRLPKEALLDVGQFIWFGASGPVCDQIVHSSIDQAAHSIDTNEFRSIQRWLLYETADGRTVLQDTDTSDRDFENSSRTPGEVGG